MPSGDVYLYQVTATDGGFVDRKCKRIIEGKTYNTETATRVAGWDDDNSEDGTWDSGKFLYQNRHGAFFLYSYLDGADEMDFDKIEPYTPEQAREWLEKNCSWNPELIESLFGAMPEAGSGEVKYTLRLPESLRDRLAILAKANQQSLNAWIVRCLESCAEVSTSEADTLSCREIPPMGNMVGSNATGWRKKGT